MSIRLGQTQRSGRCPELTVEIPEANVRQKFTTDDAGYAPISFKARTQLWSPENPKLYQVTISSAAIR